MKSLLISFALFSHLAFAETLWIDVRTADEYKAGHLAGAIHIPYDEIAEKITAVNSDKTADIQLYCRSGRRSGIALETLRGLGYTKVTNAGGYEQLKQKQSVANE